jgi:(R,R)-butanediol dehydrogenase/meso-butanediol dehydrogenase/diacetyl reductase
MESYMKAIRFYAKEDVRVDNVASPDVVGDSQVLVRPLTCGICGTDLHEFAGGPIVTPSTPHKFTGAMLPQILGHEFSAEVLETGPSVTRVRKGDRISIQPLVMPLDDYYSRRGLNHLSPSMGCVGLSWAWGGMGELAIINDYNANPIPDNVTDEQGAMVEPREDHGRQHRPGDGRRPDRSAGGAHLQRGRRLEDFRQRAQRQ